MEIRAIRQEEQKYTYDQSTQLESQTGSIGLLQGDFGASGTEYYNHTWNGNWKIYQTKDFQAELDAVISFLRSEEVGLLSSRTGMVECVEKFPDSAFSENRDRECGLRVDTEKHVYLIRCCPSKGSYNIYCYVASYLDSHIEKARQGISFRDKNYQEEFRISDGDKIIITMPWGSKREEVCRFIDEYHTEFGGAVYHIDELAQIMHEEGGATCKPKIEESQNRKREQEQER